MIVTEQVIMAGAVELLSEESADALSAKVEELSSSNKCESAEDKIKALESELEIAEGVNRLQSGDICDMNHRIDYLERIIADLLDGQSKWWQIQDMTGETEERAKAIEKTGKECLTKFYG